MARHTIGEVTVGNLTLKTGQPWTPKSSSHHGRQYLMRVIGFTPRQVIVHAEKWGHGQRNKVWTVPFDKFVKTNRLVV